MDGVNLKGGRLNGFFTLPAPNILTHSGKASTMKKEVEDSLKNLHLVISEFRGEVNGKILTGNEHLEIASSVRTVVSELNRLYEVEKQSETEKKISEKSKKKYVKE